VNVPPITIMTNITITITTISITITGGAVVVRECALHQGQIVEEQQTVHLGAARCTGSVLSACLLV
jgi:hypothetical protein